MDRIQLIANTPSILLKDAKYLEDLIPQIGFNREMLNEQPEIVRNNGGGLLIWQYPNQFSKYLVLLSTLSINSYIEIGCRWGGTFILTMEYLKKFNSPVRGVAVDIIDSPVSLYTDGKFMKMDSGSNEFANYMDSNSFDLIFIDGDHSYEGVSNDYNISKNSGNYFVFHDIVNDACPGVVRFWNELKQTETDCDFYEFVDQYQEVFDRTGGKKYLGIGVMIKKKHLE
jgi:cephalosporin hydroxylase